MPGKTQVRTVLANAKRALDRAAGMDRRHVEATEKALSLSVLEQPLTWLRQLPAPASPDCQYSAERPVEVGEVI